MVGGKSISMVGRVSKVHIPVVVVQIPLGMHSGFEFPTCIFMIRPHLVIYSLNVIHSKLQLLRLVIVCNFIHLVLNTSLKEDLIHSSLNMLMNSTQVFVGISPL